MPNERAFPFNEFDRLHPNGFATLGKEKSTTYSNQFYVVATEIGGLYFYILHSNSVELLVHYEWDEVPNELFKTDHKNNRTYRHKKKVLLTIFIGNEEGKEVAKLIERRKKILLLARPWYRKIPGYRSGKVWKMLVASLIYFSLLSGIVDGDDDEDKADPVKTEQIKTIKAEDSEEKNTADDKAKKEAEAKEKAKEERERKAKIAAQKKAEEKEAAKRAAEKKAEEKKAAELAAQKEAEEKAEEERIAQEEEEAAAEVVQTDFANCTDLRTVYPDGVPSDHPAYQDKMDRDNDAFACEQN